VTVKNERKRAYSLKRVGKRESVQVEEGSPSSPPASPVPEKNGNGKAGDVSTPTTRSVSPKKEEEKGVEMSVEELLAQRELSFLFLFLGS